MLRDAAHQRHAVPRVRAGREPVDQLGGVGGRSGAVTEPEAPQEQHRLAAVLEVARARRDLKCVDQILPVGLEPLHEVRVVDARDVVLDREHAALGLGARLHVPRDLVACGEEARVLYLRDEALEGDAVDAGLLHPREVARDGPRVVRRVEPRDRAVGVREVGRIELVRAELGGVWPQIDRQVRRGRRVVAEPVPPLVHRRAVSGAQEPALISEQHLALEAGGVDDRRERRRSSRTVVRRSLVAVNGRRVGLITFRRGRRASHAADRGDEQDGREADGFECSNGVSPLGRGCGLIGRRGREEGLLEVAEARPPLCAGRVSAGHRPIYGGGGRSDAWSPASA